MDERALKLAETTGKPLRTPMQIDGFVGCEQDTSIFLSSFPIRLSFVSFYRQFHLSPICHIRCYKVMAGLYFLKRNRINPEEQDSDDAGW